MAGTCSPSPSRGHPVPAFAFREDGFGFDQIAHVVSYYHMSQTSTLKRTSMSLDQETLGALELLATKWNTSKSEVIRRAVRKTSEEEAAKSPRMTPIEALRWLRKNGISREATEAWKDDIRLEREARPNWWDDRTA